MVWFCETRKYVAFRTPASFHVISEINDTERNENCFIAISSRVVAKITMEQYISEMKLNEMTGNNNEMTLNEITIVISFSVIPEMTI